MSKLLLKTNLKDITIDSKGNIVVSFNVLDVSKYRFEQVSEQIQNLDKEAKDGLRITIDKFRHKRTLTQNDALWYLCDELAKVHRTTKEAIYKEYVYKVGRWETLPIRNDVVDFFIKSWESQGVGWQCLNIRKSKLEGYTNIDCYFGTSVYDTKEMARLLEEVIEDCKEYNIDWTPYVDKSLLEKS